MKTFIIFIALSLTLNALAADKSEIISELFDLAKVVPDNRAGTRTAIVICKKPKKKDKFCIIKSYRGPMVSDMDSYLEFKDSKAVEIISATLTEYHVRPESKSEIKREYQGAEFICKTTEDLNYQICEVNPHYYSMTM